MTTLRALWDGIRSAPRSAAPWWVVFGLGLFYEWGPFNEIAVTAGATSVFEPGVRSVLTGVVAAAIVTVTQLALGWVAVMAFTTSGPELGAVLGRLPIETPPDEATTGRRLWIAFILGATALALWAVAAGRTTRTALGRIVTEAAFGAGLVTLAIGLLVAGVASGIHEAGQPELAQRIIDVVGSPLLWIGLFALVETIGVVQRRRQD